MYSTDNGDGPFEPIILASSQRKSSANNIRFASVLSFILQSHLPIHTIYHSRKHIAVVLSDQKTLVVFDNVPLWAHPDSVDPASIFDSLGSSPTDSTLLSFKNKLKEKELLLMTLEDGTLMAWEWQTDNWKWSARGSAILRLPSRSIEINSSRRIQSTTFCSGNRIYWMESVIEDESATLKDDPRCFAFGLFCSEFRISSSRPTTPQLPDTAISSFSIEVSNSVMIAAFEEGNAQLFPSKNGLWIVTSSLVAGSNQLQRLNVMHHTANSNKLELIDIEMEVLYWSFHPTTGELLLLDFDSNLQVVTLQGLQYLSTLQVDNQYSLLDYRQMVTFQHAMVLIKDREMDVFDIRSGVSFGFVQSPSVQPIKLWNQLQWKDSAIGFWNVDGMWRLRAVPVTDYCRVISSKSPPIPSFTSFQDLSTPPHGLSISTTMSSALVASDWQLNRWKSRYLLDVLLNFSSLDNPSYSDTVTFLAACNALVPHLQSPILLVSILEEANMSKSASSIAQQFIDACLARHSQGTSSFVSQNEVDNNAYQLFTTLNGETMRLLQKYLELQNSGKSFNSMTPDFDPLSQSSPIEVKSARDIEIRNMVEALTPSDMQRLDLNIFQLCFNHCPKLLLTKLEQFSLLPIGLVESQSKPFLDCIALHDLVGAVMMDLSPVESIPINLDLLKEQDKNKQMDFFDLMCYLYYIYEPQHILPFVDVLIKREDQIEAKSNIPRRALAAIPAFDSPNVHKYSATDDQIVEIRLALHVGLLLRAHRCTSAMRLILNFYRISHNDRHWKWVVELIETKKSPNQTKHRTEMVTALMTHCIDPANQLTARKYFDDIWNLMSDDVSSLDLVTSLRQELFRIHPNPEPVVLDDNNQSMTVDTLRAQLLKLGVD